MLYIIMFNNASIAQLSLVWSRGVTTKKVQFVAIEIEFQRTGAERGDYSILILRSRDLAVFVQITTIAKN